jgi:Arc/MetJ family transcription regulator
VPKTASKSRRPPTSKTAKLSKPTARPGKPGRPSRAPGRERRQIVVDAALLDAAMRLTGRGQSDTVNVALAQLTENAAILGGLAALHGAFPTHPDHESHETTEGR